MLAAFRLTSAAYHPGHYVRVSTYHDAITTDDDFLGRLGRFNDARSGGALVERRQGGYTLHHEASAPDRGAPPDRSS